MNGPDYTSIAIVLAGVALLAAPVVIALLIALPIIAYDRLKARHQAEKELSDKLKNKNP